MSVQPNRLPRTLKGVNGAKFINVPGVHYPDEVLEKNVTKKRKGSDSSTPITDGGPPDWGITTADAAKLYGVAPAVMRNYCEYHKVPHKHYKLKGRVPCIYWNKKVLEKLVSSKTPLIENIPDDLCTSKEAQELIGCARVSLLRYARHNKWIHEFHVRKSIAGAPRAICLYIRDECKELGIMLDERRRLEARVQKLHAQIPAIYTSREKGGYLDYILESIQSQCLATQSSKK